MLRKNEALPLFVWCVWLLPLASVKFLTFGWPLYPIEGLLLAALPFFPYQEYRFLLRFPVVRGGAIFSGALIIGAIASYMANPETLAGLGQIKSFFFFPLLLALFILPSLRERENRNVLLSHMRLMMLVVATAALLTLFFGGMTYDYRLHAWFQSPNLLALFLLPGSVLWWARIVMKDRASGLDFAAWIIIATALLLTRSYGSIFAGILSGAYLILRFRAKIRVNRKIYIFAAIALIVFGIVEMGTRKGEMIFSWNERSSGESRMMIWRSAEKMIRDHPIIGIGPGRFQEIYLEYQRFYPPYLEWAVPHPHNLFLSFWLSAGALGAGSLLWLALFLIRTFRQSVTMSKEKTLISALFISFFAAGLFDVPYFRSELCILFWMYLAFFIALYSRMRSEYCQSSI